MSRLAKEMPHFLKQMSTNPTKLRQRYHAKHYDVNSCRRSHRCSVVSLQSNSFHLYQGEREAKYALKRELDKRINSESMLNLSNLALSTLRMGQYGVSAPAGTRGCG